MEVLILAVIIAIVYVVYLKYAAARDKYLSKRNNIRGTKMSKNYSINPRTRTK
jgi:hypothetical protein